jgi:hypothetical protein
MSSEHRQNFVLLHTWRDQAWTFDLPQSPSLATSFEWHLHRLDEAPNAYSHDRGIRYFANDPAVAHLDFRMPLSMTRHDSNSMLPTGTDRFGPFIPPQYLFYISYIFRILSTCNRTCLHRTRAYWYGRWMVLTPLLLFTLLLHLIPVEAVRSGPVPEKRLYGRFASTARFCPHMRTAKGAFMLKRRKTVMFAGNQDDFKREFSKGPFRTAAIG